MKSPALNLPQGIEVAEITDPVESMERTLQSVMWLLPAAIVSVEQNGWDDSIVRWLQKLETNGVAALAAMRQQTAVRSLRERQEHEKALQTAMIRRGKPKPAKDAQKAVEAASKANPLFGAWMGRTLQ